MVPIPLRNPQTTQPTGKFAQTLKQISKTRIAYVFMTPTIIVLAAIVFYPLIYGISLSFTDATFKNVAAYIGVNYRPASYSFIGFQNYIDLLTDASYKLFQITIQTIFWTFSNVSLHFLIGLLLAIILNRKLPGRSVFRIILLIPWAIPQVISSYAWLWLFNSQYGFFNLFFTQINQWLGFTLLQPVQWTLYTPSSWVTVISTNVWLGFPFMTVTLLGGLQSIPKELYEAATVDGANIWQQFWKVTLPLLRPIAVTATLLGTIWTFNMFTVIFLVTGGGPDYTTDILATYAYQWGITRGQYFLGATYAVFILAILLVFSYFYRKLLRSSEGVY